MNVNLINSVDLKGIADAGIVGNKDDITVIQPHARNVYARREAAAPIVPDVQHIPLWLSGIVGHKGSAVPQPMQVGWYCIQLKVF